MLRRSRRVGARRWAVPVAALVAVAVAAPVTAAASTDWKPGVLAKRAVAKDLKRLAPSFQSFLSNGRCHGSSSTQHCVVTGSISNDDVRAQVTLTHRSSSVKYTDHVSLTAVMGGGSVKYTYRGSI